MSNSTLSIASLVGSRICHDLISPVGAISNGIELIAMGGPIDTPELSLISESVDNATARIKFFRVAFGAASGDQMIGAPEIAKIAREAFSSGRHTVDWQARGDLSRPEVQAVFLAILCIETALTRGGTITVTRNGTSFEVSGSGDRINCDPALWKPLAATTPPYNLRPAQVQFALLPFAAQDLGRKLSLQDGPREVRIAL